MKLHRLRIQNFRNFKELDVELGDQVVIVGENKIGKSNLLHALRLVLDPSLPDSARQLQKTDFWDGLGESLTKEDVISIAVELTDFEGDEDLMAVLAEHLMKPEPMVARLTYVFYPKPDLEQDPNSEADYEFSMYGGDRPENRVGYDVRRRIPLDVLHALRDAERDMSSWSRSPLKPLLDEAAKSVDRTRLTEIAKDVLATTNKVLDAPRTVETAVQTGGEAESESTLGETPGDELKDKPIRQVAHLIASRLESMVGSGQALDTILGFSPTDPDRLIRAIRLLIDGGKRTVGDASLGSANLLYLTLKSIELEQLAELGVRDHTFLAIEEPEAHLHPHLQRLVYRDFLRQRSHQEAGNRDGDGAQRHQTVLLTTHSPHIVSVAPLRSIVLLKHSADGTHTTGRSAAKVPLASREVEDIERYLDVERGELLFAKGVVLVEGDAEQYLVPVFGKLLDADFDELGISVCSVSGTNFAPYARLLSEKGLGIPFAILTDFDPQDDGTALGPARVIKLLAEVMEQRAFATLSHGERLSRAAGSGIFMNDYTLEIDLFRSGCHREMCETLVELTDNEAAQNRASTWYDDPSAVTESRLLKDIGAIGKGRFAQRLAARVRADGCPSYIREAIEYVATKC